MKEDVSVRVCGVQRCPGAEEDVSELVCEGVFKHTADGWLLAYEEPSEAGTVKTLLRFADGRVTLTRRGAVRSEMTFAAGECHTIFYELPLGRLTMELHTDSVCAALDGAHGTLELCYRLTVRDCILLALISGLCALVLAFGGMEATYTPYLYVSYISGGFIAYCVLLLIPPVMYLWERILWNSFKFKT